MLEVEENHLDEDQRENTADQEQRKRCDHQREDREHNRAENGWPEFLPAPVTRLEALHAREANRTPSHDPPRPPADDRPESGEQVRAAVDECHGSRVSRIASRGAARPVHSRNEIVPCASRTSHPSTAGTPSERALRTIGVPPFT